MPQKRTSLRWRQSPHKEASREKASSASPPPPGGRGSQRQSGLGRVVSGDNRAETKSDTGSKQTTPGAHTRKH